MEERPIETKQRNIWPWLLAVILIGGLVWWLTDDPDIEGTAMEGEVEDIRGTQTAVEEGEQQDPVEQFIAFVEDHSEEIGVQHEFTHQGLTYLADALQAFAQEQQATPEVNDRISQLKEMANRLTMEPESEQHANIMAEAFLTAAEIIENMETQISPELDESEDVLEAARNIKPDVPATEQQQEIKSFFDEAAAAIENIRDYVPV